jgi:phage baseplate assembly protein W
MTAFQDITAKDWSPKLGAFGEVVTNDADIAQCIRIICTTQLGSVPLRPEFGCEIFKWLDAPLDVAIVNIPLEIFQSIGRWEPRVLIDSVQVFQGEGIAELFISLKWRVVRSNETQTLTLTNADFTEARRTMALAATEADTLTNMSITDYRNEFLNALNN